MIKVTKCGGSSVANAKQFAKVKHIIHCYKCLWKRES